MFHFPHCLNRITPTKFLMNHFFKHYFFNLPTTINLLQRLRRQNIIKKINLICNLSLCLSSFCGMIVISSCPSSPISGFLSLFQHFPIKNFFSFLDCSLCSARQHKKEAKKSIENNDNKLNKLGKNHFLKVIVGWDKRQQAVVVCPFSSLLQSDKHHSIPWTLKYVCRWNTKTTKPQGEGEKIV